MTKVLLISVVVYSLIAVWYVAPWLKKLDKRQALTAPLWVHVFRYLCLYLPIAQRDGYAISDRILHVVVVGDLSGAVLALAAIIFLRMRSRLGPFFAGLVLIASLIDIVVGTCQGRSKSRPV
jgi:predicted membrane channel-forming protein YqfA (hemolysin III family)